MTLLRAVANPIVGILLLLITGILLTRDLRRQKLFKSGWYLLALGISILFLLSISPVSDGLVYFLESQYQPPSKEAISKADIIVILNGGVSPSGGFRKKPEASGATYSRVFNGVEIFKQCNAKILALSGIGDQKDIEGTANVMKDFAISLGVPADKIIVEPKSRNTFEHTVELAKLFPPTKDLKIGIVTSALHMPRSVQLFQKKFPPDAIIPLPVGYIYSPLEYEIESLIPSSHTLSKSSYAIHELLGMIWYKYLV
ncbi:MAG: YdcF family protein [Nitrospinae bacterium]|nr:YdcF family protein [Nitrospinota bacterium]